MRPCIRVAEPAFLTIGIGVPEIHDAFGFAVASVAVFIFRAERHLENQAAAARREPDKIDKRKEKKKAKKEKAPKNPS